MHLTHPALPKLIEVFVDDSKNIHFVKEFCQGGFISQFKDLNTGFIEEIVVFDIAQ